MSDLVDELRRADYQTAESLCEEAADLIEQLESIIVSSLEVIATQQELIDAYRIIEKDLKQKTRPSIETNNEGA